jgi:Lamin Tail Domain
MWEARESRITDQSTIVSAHKVMIIEMRPTILTLLAVFLSVSHGLLFTELMLNPTSASDTNTQWFEIYNSDNYTVELEGYRFRHCNGIKCNVFTFASSYSIAPNEYAVLGNNNNSATNGGLILLQLKMTPLLKDGSGVNFFGIMQPMGCWYEDVLTWTIGNVQSPDVRKRTFVPGASLSRVSVLAANSDTANWITSNTPINCLENGDKGTPGKPNAYICPVKTRTLAPTMKPTREPTKKPTREPTKKPTTVTTKTPTRPPARTPGIPLSEAPANATTNKPTKTPTINAPTVIGTPDKVPMSTPKIPTRMPTELNVPTKTPVKTSESSPTRSPSKSAPFKAPVYMVAPSKTPVVAKRCGILGLRIVCRNGCGIMGRLLKICVA